VNSSGAVRKTKKALQQAFAYQQQKAGTCFIEILANCPSNWKMTPLETTAFINDEMTRVFPLGDIKIPAREGVK
jgi:2-oxoglutarate ferredoxin oxidoreductase subunit beta